MSPRTWWGTSWASFRPPDVQGPLGEGGDGEVVEAVLSRIVQRHKSCKQKRKHRYIRISPQKARLVVDLIRGQKAGTALTTLRTTNKRIAPTVEKVLQVGHRQRAATEPKTSTWTSCLCREAYVNEGPRMKRVRPAPMGRAYRYQRRMAHIVIKVAEKEA